MCSHKTLFGIMVFSINVFAQHADFLNDESTPKSLHQRLTNIEQLI